MNEVSCEDIVLPYRALEYIFKSGNITYVANKGGELLI